MSREDEWAVRSAMLRDARQFHQGTEDYLTALREATKTMTDAAKPGETPLTDLLFHQICQRERVAEKMPSRWSYEAVLDLLGHGKAIERRLIDSRAEVERLREGWIQADKTALADRVALSSAYERAILACGQQYLNSAKEPSDEKDAWNSAVAYCIGAILALPDAGAGKVKAAGQEQLDDPILAENIVQPVPRTG